MTKAEARLEILRVCYRRDQDSLTILKEARAFEEWINEPEPKTLVDREPSKAGKTAGKTAPVTPGK